MLGIKGRRVTLEKTTRKDIMPGAKIYRIEEEFCENLDFGPDCLRIWILASPGGKGEIRIKLIPHLGQIRVDLAGGAPFIVSIRRNQFNDPSETITYHTGHVPTSRRDR